MGIIEGWAISSFAKWAIGSVAGLFLTWLLGKIPTGKWSKQLSSNGQKVGAMVTAFCNKKIPFWEKFFEPVFIDTIGVLLAWFAGFIVGLKSDNK
jgi:ABC-type phosphate/phosphonate transport system permease subunit